MNARVEAVLSYSIDIATRLAFSAVFFLLLLRTHQTLGERWDINVVLLTAKEGVAAALLVTSRLTHDVDRRPISYLITMGMAFYLFAVDFSASDIALPELITSSLQGVGLAVSLLGVLSLGRSFGVLPANRGVVRRGLYGFVRHPVYAGYAVVMLAYLLSAINLTNVAVIAGMIALMAMRIRLEERVLLRDPTYASYAQKVRYRFLPGLF